MTTTLPQAIIIDVDGTVALMGDRDPYDWARVHEDTPNGPVIQVVRTVVASGCTPIVVSGRLARCEDATRRWLAEHVFHGGLSDDFELHMRPVGDGRPDAELKAEIYATIIAPRYSVLGVFDDRDSVVAMWRSLGLTVFQVNYGTF